MGKGRMGEKEKRRIGEGEKYIREYYRKKIQNQ